MQDTRRTAATTYSWIAFTLSLFFAVASYADEGQTAPSPWRLEKSPKHVNLKAVAGYGSNLVVAGGKSGDVVLWDGVAWKSMPRLPVPHYYDPGTPAQRAFAWATSRGSTIVDIDIVSPNSIWAITEFDVFEWNGERWKEYPVYPIPGIRYPIFVKIRMTSPTHGYIVGSQPPSKALVLELRDSKWQVRNADDSSPTKEVGDLSGLALLPSGDGWAGGRNAFIRITNGKWIKTDDAPYKNFFVGDIALENASTGWATHGFYALRDGKWGYVREVCGPYCVQGGELGSNNSISVNAAGAAYIAGSHMSEAPRLKGSSVTRWDAASNTWIHDLYIEKEEITDIVVLDSGKVFAVARSGKIWSRD